MRNANSPLSPSTPCCGNLLPRTIGTPPPKSPKKDKGDKEIRYPHAPIALLLFLILFGVSSAYAKSGDGVTVTLLPDAWTKAGLPNHGGAIRRVAVAPAPVPQQLPASCKTACDTKATDAQLVDTLHRRNRKLRGKIWSLKRKLKAGSGSSRRSSTSNSTTIMQLLREYAKEIMMNRKVIKNLKDRMRKQTAPTASNTYKLAVRLVLENPEESLAGALAVFLLTLLTFLLKNRKNLEKQQEKLGNEHTADLTATNGAHQRELADLRRQLHSKYNMMRKTLIAGHMEQLAGLNARIRELEQIVSDLHSARKDVQHAADLDRQRLEAEVAQARLQMQVELEKLRHLSNTSLYNGILRKYSVTETTTCDDTCDAMLDDDSRTEPLSPPPSQTLVVLNDSPTPLNGN